MKKDITSVWITENYETFMTSGFFLLGVKVTLLTLNYYSSLVINPKHVTLLHRI